jgi:hypothetical protein
MSGLREALIRRGVKPDGRGRRRFLQMLTAALVARAAPCAVHGAFAAPPPRLEQAFFSDGSCLID